MNPPPAQLVPARRFPPRPAPNALVPLTGNNGGPAFTRRLGRLFAISTPAPGGCFRGAKFSSESLKKERFPVAAARTAFFGQEPSSSGCLLVRGYLLLPRGFCQPVETANGKKQIASLN